MDIALLPECDKSHNALVSSDLILEECINGRFWGGGESCKWVANHAGGFIGVTVLIVCGSAAFILTAFYVHPLFPLIRFWIYAPFTTLMKNSLPNRPVPFNE